MEPNEAIKTVRAMQLHGKSNGVYDSLALEIERLQKEVRRWQLRQRIGWYDPDTKRFCYSDVKDAYSASHASYLIPVFIEAAKAAEGE